MITHQSAPRAAARQPDPLRTPVEAAAQLGVQPNTLEVWRTNKRYTLAYVKVGRLVRYRQSAIDAFVDSRTVQVSA
ncbi:MAG TPA: helix-turn-helix domain-containing protein [Burkholderiaceae bacterium]